MSLDAPAPARTLLDGVAILLAWVIPAGILVQAVLAGQGWFVDQGLMALHGGVGHGVLTAAGLVTAWMWWRRPSWTVVALASFALVGLIGQTGLGYAGRRSGIALASSLHIPLGSVLLATTLLVAVLLVLPSRSRA